MGNKKSLLIPGVFIIGGIFYKTRKNEFKTNIRNNMLTNTHSYVRKHRGQKIVDAYLFNRQHALDDTSENYKEEGYENYTEQECNICPTSMKSPSVKSTINSRLPHLITKNKFKAVMRQLKIFGIRKQRKE